MAELITKIKNRSGQSLIEILIAISIGALIIGAAVLSISVALRSNTANVGSAFASPLAKELLEKARIIAEGKWTDVYDQPRATDLYIVSDTGGVQKIIRGQEGVASNDIQNGLIGYWKFDEASGTTAYDATANNNKGDLISNPAPTGACKVGRCLSFNGTSAYVSVPSSASLPNANISVSTWAKLTTHVSWNDIIRNNWGSVAGSWLLYSDSSGIPRFGIRDASFGQHNASCSSAFSLNNWHHFVGTYDGSTVKLYVDSTLCPTTNSLSGQSLYTAGAIELGEHQAGSATHYLDDVRIYNRALSSEEVFQLYNSRPYTRSFKIENVFRQDGNIVSSGGTEDPSTQKITATVSWGDNLSLSISEYITRNRNDVTQESDWSGGNFDSGASEAIDASTPGEIKLSN